MPKSLESVVLAVLLPAVFLSCGAGAAVAGYAATFGPYVSFGYAPAWGGAKNLYMGVPGETWYVLPYKKDASDDEVLSWSSFDWWSGGGGAPGDDPVKFREISPRGVSGAVGYALGNARVELGVMKEEFAVSRAGGRRWREGDSLFLLLGQRGADLAQWLRPRVGASTGTDKLTTELTALLDVLRRGLGGLSDSEEKASVRTTLNLVGSATIPGSKWADNPSTVKLLRAALGEALPKIWPHLTIADKAKVRLTLAGGREEGDVVAIPAVGLTVVTVVGCRDLALSSLFTAEAAQNLAAYGCAGMGASFVRSAGGSAAEFGAGLKFGVSYRLSRAASVFVGGVLHRTVNCDFDVPVTPVGAGSGSAVVKSRAIDRAGNEARLSFGMLNLVGEVGLRFLV